MKENVNKHCKVLFKDELLWDSVNNNNKKKRHELKKVVENTAEVIN